MPIRALLMDIDDTLFDFRTSSREALAIAFAEHEIPFTDALLARYVRFVQRFAPACQHFAPSLFRSSSTGGRISSSTTAAARKMDGVGTVLTTPRSM